MARLGVHIGTRRVGMAHVGTGRVSTAVRSVLVGAMVVVVTALVLAPTASASFPGANGLLAVQPAHAGGIVLVRPDGRGGHRICTDDTRCGSPRRPRWSADGRALVFTGPRIKIIAPDGSCMSCQFEKARNAAFEPRGSVISSIQNGHVRDDGIDGLRAGLPAVGAASDAVWSASGRVAIVHDAAIWVGDRDTQRRLAAGAQPSWSPNGRVIAAVQRGWIITLHVRNRRVRRLVRGSAPAFSPDGRWIAYVAPSHQLMIASASGRPRPRRVGRIQAVSVDWQPRPRTRMPGCVPPPGSTVISSSREAVVTGNDLAHQPPLDFSVSPTVVYMGCLRADGRERVLERFVGNNIDSASTVAGVTFAAPYAGLTVSWSDDHYGGSSTTLQVFDLRKGQLTDLGGESVNCPNYGIGCIGGGFAAVALGHDGVSAVHIRTTDPLGFGSIGIGDVACAPASNACVAVDLAGHLFSSANAAAGHPAWRQDTVAGSPAAGAFAVTCPSTSLCVSVGGRITTTTNPTSDPPTWTSAAFPGPNIGGASAVSCPSPTLCVANRYDGRIATTTNPTGGTAAWSLGQLGTGTGFGPVFCSAQPQCVIPQWQNTLFTSTNPAGGPPAWTRSSGVPALGAGTCPTPNLCIATGDKAIFTTTDPGTGPWNRVAVGHNLDSVSCPSASLCLAVGPAGALDVSTNPGAGTWTHTTIDQGQPLNDIACPSASLCVATDGIGHVITSTDPTGGPSTWHSTLIEGDPCTDTTPCSEEQIQTSDRAGVHTVDTSKFPGAGPFLTGLALTGDTLTWSHAGALRTVTLHP